MAVGLLVAIYALMAVGLAVFQRRFLYFPDRRLTHPAEAGMSGVEELRLVTDDGEMLVAWHLPPREGHPLILYFHGNGGAAKPFSIRPLIAQPIIRREKRSITRAR